MNSERKSKRQERRDKIRKQQSRGRIYMILGITILAIVIVGLVALPGIMNATRPMAEVVSIDPGTHPNPNDNSMGDPNAPIKIEEFSDFQCPYCERFHSDTEPQLRQYFIDTGKVLFTYRSMGNWVSQNMGGGNNESEDAAAAAYCAGEQNKYWEMHAMLFANVKGEDVGSFTDKRSRQSPKRWTAWTSNSSTAALTAASSRTASSRTWQTARQQASPAHLHSS